MSKHAFLSAIRFYPLRSNFSAYLWMLFFCLLIATYFSLSLFTSCTEDPCAGLMDSLEWMDVSEDYDVQSQIGLANTFKLAMEADVEKLELLKEGKLGLDHSSEVARTMNKVSSKQAKVSQEFYQSFLTYRAEACFIAQLLDKGVLTDPKAISEAQQKLLQLSSELRKSASVTSSSNSNSNGNSGGNKTFSCDDLIDYDKRLERMRSNLVQEQQKVSSLLESRKASGDQYTLDLDSTKILIRKTDQLIAFTRSQLDQDIRHCANRTLEVQALQASLSRKRYYIDSLLNAHKLSP